jgi:hypothetical protein
VAILALAGFMLFRNTRPVPNTMVSAWVEVRKYPIDPAKPMSRENPADPKKQATITVFGCFDGKLEIREFPNDPIRKPSIAWREVDKRRKTYLYWKDPLTPVKSVTDPYKHAIALAAYSAANGRRLGLMNNAGLTKEQLEQEAAARKIMMDTLTVTKMQVDDGSFKPDQLKPVMEALKAYRNTEGDPQKDQKKADAARKVIELAAKYLDVVEQYRSDIIEKYIAAMNKILTSDQKTIVAKAGQAYETPRNVRLAAGPAAPAAPAAGAGVNLTQTQAPAANRGNANPNRANPQNRGNNTPRQGSAAPRNVEAVKAG